MNRLIRRAISTWQFYQTKRRLYRALPALREFDMAEREAQKRHRRVNDIRKARTVFITEALRAK
jgi:hypothetical protein